MRPESQLEQYLSDREKSANVVGNLYLTDLVWGYVRSVRPLAARAGLLKREVKKYTTIMEEQMNRHGISARKQFGDRNIDGFADTFDEMGEEKWGGFVQAMYDAVKRQIDRIVPDGARSAAVCHYSVIYMLTGLHLERTDALRLTLSSRAGVALAASYSGAMLSVHNASMHCLELLMPGDASTLTNAEMVQTYQTFRASLEEVADKVHIHWSHSGQSSAEPLKNENHE